MCSVIILAKLYFRLKKGSSNGSIELDEVDRAVPDLDIAAASVIAGDEVASINIPYMTPPVGPAEHPLNAQPRQGHYSGDSHDSSSKNNHLENFFLI